MVTLVTHHENNSPMSCTWHLITLPIPQSAPRCSIPGDPKRLKKKKKSWKLVIVNATVRGRSWSWVSKRLCCSPPHPIPHTHTVGSREMPWLWHSWFQQAVKRLWRPRRVAVFEIQSWVCHLPHVGLVCSSSIWRIMVKTCKGGFTLGENLTRSS